MPKNGQESKREREGSRNSIAVTYFFNLLFILPSPLGLKKSSSDKEEDEFQWNKIWGKRWGRRDLKELECSLEKKRQCQLCYLKLVKLCLENFAVASSIRWCSRCCFYARKPFLEFLHRLFWKERKWEGHPKHGMSFQNDHHTLILAFGPLHPALQNTPERK